MATFKVLYELKYDLDSPNNKQLNNIQNFYAHHRMKIYDSSKVDLTWEDASEEPKESKQFSFDIAEELLEKYKDEPEIYRILKRLEENKKVYKVIIQPNRSPGKRDDEIGAFYKAHKAKYEKEGCPNPAISITQYVKMEISKEFFSKDGLEKHGVIYPKWNYLVTIFSKGLSGLFQQLFISTLAYENSCTKWPNGVSKENFEIEFDTQNNVAKLVDANVYNPDNPFNKYLRQTTRRVIRRTNSSSDKDDTEIIDYYMEDYITSWTRYSVDEFATGIKSGDNTYGIYMLYDSEKGFFYVGKAEHVYTRMKEHKDSREEIRDFDYFRYSLIDPYYYDDIFLIENAAIHDGAMLFNMAKNKDYKEKSLAVILPDGRDIKDVIMLNTVKKQTKRTPKQER